MLSSRAGVAARAAVLVVASRLTHLSAIDTALTDAVAAAAHLTHGTLFTARAAIVGIGGQIGAALAADREQRASAAALPEHTGLHGGASAITLADRKSTRLNS